MAVQIQLQRIKGATALVAVALGLLLVAAPASAATITVTSKLDAIVDDRACTLREAVIAADVDAAVLGCEGGSGGDVILLGAGTYPLTIAPSTTPYDAGSGSLDVIDPEGSALTITSAGLSVIDASAIADRALTARSDLDLHNIEVTGGNSAASPEDPGRGGAVHASGDAKLTVRRSVLSGNSATVAGGAVHAEGPLDVLESTISGNSVSGPAGGGGGAIDAGGLTTITRATIAANSVVSGDGTGVGGGLRYSGTVTLTGSILADNSADGGDPDCAAGGGSGSSGGYNVIERAGGGCGIALTPSDQQVDPGLAPLADNGGGTLTQAIDPSSPAVNAGPAGPACAGTDQRGAPRGTAESGACDAGAYELAFCVFSAANVIGSDSPDYLQPSRSPASMLGLGAGDVLIGGPGNDALCGGAGIDRLQGGAGADLIIGGPDVDIASYLDATTPVSVILDNVANDGRAGEGDLVQTESVIGGAAADVLRGNAAPNGIQGSNGNDRIDGLAGNDSVLGGAGNDLVNGNVGNDQVRGDDGDDTLVGLDGNDRLDGGNGDDTLDGGAGNDRLFGERGRDELLGGDGNDVLTGGPDRDVLECGAGRDTAFADKQDKVARDCERVIREKRKGKGGKGKGGKGKGKGKGGKGKRSLLTDPGAAPST